MASKPQKTVLIGITGCIAAYKAAEIVRGLQKADVRVKVMMTEHATPFYRSAHISCAHQRAGSGGTLR